MSVVNNDDVATKLLVSLSAEIIRKSDMFDYLCWLGENDKLDSVKGAPFLVLASDSTCCWGDTYEQAVGAAFAHDQARYEAQFNT